jgi:hypothetical protein
MKTDKQKLVPEKEIRTLAYLAKNRKIPSYDKPFKATRNKTNRDEGWDG